LPKIYSKHKGKIRYTQKIKAGKKLLPKGMAYKKTVTESYQTKRKLPQNEAQICMRK
jgi:hypothetical protein